MPDTQIQLTREQLAKFLPDSRAIKAFEQLMLATGTTIPEDLTVLTQLIEDASLEAGSGLAKADLALALISKIDTQVVQGAQGIPGMRGEDGEDGLTIIYSQGISGGGGAGATGPQGPQGIPGPAGENFSGDAAVVMVANPNLIGPITSVGSVTSVDSQTGTGSTFVMQNSPTLVTPALGVATVTSINKVGFTAPTTAATFVFGTDNATFTMQGTDTYVGRATADTFTNKTYDTAGTGNVLKINGTTVSAITGTGAVVLATSPTLTTPALGTPSALVGTNITGTAAALNIGGNAATATTAINQSGGTVSATTITATSGLITPFYPDGILGSVSGTPASAGSVGETILGSGTAVSIITGTPTAIASVPLTAGNWIVFGNLSFNYGPGTNASLLAAMLNPSVGIPSQEYYSIQQIIGGTNAANSLIPPMRIVNTNSSITYYLVAYATFIVNTLSGTGYLYAVRIP